MGDRRALDHRQADLCRTTTRRHNDETFIIYNSSFIITYFDPPSDLYCAKAFCLRSSSLLRGANRKPLLTQASACW